MSCVITVYSQIEFTVKRIHTQQTNITYVRTYVRTVTPSIQKKVSRLRVANILDNFLCDFRILGFFGPEFCLLETLTLSHFPRHIQIYCTS